RSHLVCGVDLDVGESEFGDTDPGGGSGVDPQRPGTTGVVVVGVDREVVDASTGAGKETHSAEDPGQPPHVLVLQVTGRRPLVDAYGQGVGSGTQKRSDVELARQSTAGGKAQFGDRKSTRLNSSHVSISYAVFCLKKKR